MKKAFTLIELLVVIAIIAILAAILFPVFAQAKDAAKKTQSLSNMKQLATSTLIYNNDFDDYMPPSAYIKGFAPQPVITSVYDVLIPYTKNVNIMVSPVDSPAQNWKARLTLLGMKNDQIEVASYVPNLGLFGDNLCPIKSLIGKTGYTPVTSATAIPDSVQTTMFFDGYIKQGTTLDYYTFLGMARHADGLVINFADGHAKYFKWNAVQSIGKDYVPSQYNTAATRPTYYGWRVDTAACGSTGLCKTNGSLQTVTSTPSNPYNDLHGVPGTAITDSEDTAVCP